MKPEFFTDEDIARLPPLYRLAFQGLWCQADKAGRLEDRPSRLKVQILPYDVVDFGEVLDALAAAAFVQRYVGSDGRAYLQIRTFDKHQRPRADEPESEIEAPERLTSIRSVRVFDSDESVTPQRLGKERKGKELEGSTSRTSSAQAVVDAWNELTTPPIPKATKLTSDRESRIAARLRTFPDLDTWRRVISWLNTQDWCRASGKGDHPNWTATLDWLCKNDGNVQRQLERAEAAQHEAEKPDMYGHFPPCANRQACRDRMLAEERAKREKKIS